MLNLKNISPITFGDSAAINQLASLVIGAAEGDLDESDGGGAKKSLLGALDFKQLLAKKKTDPVAEPAQ